MLSLHNNKPDSAKTEHSAAMQSQNSCLSCSKIDSFCLNARVLLSVFHNQLIPPTQHMHSHMHPFTHTYTQTHSYVNTSVCNITGTNYHLWPYQFCFWSPNKKNTGVNLSSLFQYFCLYKAWSFHGLIIGWHSFESKTLPYVVSNHYWETLVCSVKLL